MSVLLDSAAALALAGNLPKRAGSSAHRQSPPTSARAKVYLMSSDERLIREITVSLSEHWIEAQSVADLASLDLSLKGFEAACTIVDLNSTSVSPTEMKRVLSDRETPPTIVIGSTVDTRAVVCAIRAGAHDFFARPLDLPLLSESVISALSADRCARQRRAEIQLLKAHYGLLTAREREVLPLVVGGLLNKQAASLLGISEITLQIHRGQVMRKMQADSLADLVRMAMKLKLPYWNSSKRHEAAADAPSPSKKYEGREPYQQVRSTRGVTFAARSS